LTAAIHTGARKYQSSGALDLIFASRESGVIANVKSARRIDLTNAREIAMHFCFTGQYTPQALNNMMDNPATNRYEAAKKLIEAAGGKLIAMYGMPVDGPGVMAIIDVPEPGAAAAISGVVVASGALHNVKLVRLLTQDELSHIRQKASQLRGAYKAPAK
jgi:uncharacterized protein with GYD domain